ncbi:MAG: hypothetical protein ACOC88_04120 [Candidatus Bipolaricaulota bacterium]
MIRYREAALLGLLSLLFFLATAGDALAETPTIEDLQIDEIKKTGINWRITGSVDVLSSDEEGDGGLLDRFRDRATLVYRVYYAEDYDVGGEAYYTYTEPRLFKIPKDYIDYKVRLFVPSVFRGESVIEACLAPVKGGDDGDGGEICTTWEGWIPQEPQIDTSGSLDFDDGTAPGDSGTFESGIWSVEIKTDVETDVSLISQDLPVSRLDDPESEIPTWWKFWDEGADEDGVLEQGEQVDTGWVKIESYSPHMVLHELELPAGWDGELYVQLKMERSGLDDRAGYYSANVRVEVG